MIPPGKVQIPGFSDEDSHQEVIDKAAKGLGIDPSTDHESLTLMMSKGLVKNLPLSNGKPWTLGSFVEQLGGAQVRGKRTFGICVPDNANSDEESTSTEVYSTSYELIKYIVLLHATHIWYMTG